MKLLHLKDAGHQVRPNCSFSRDGEKRTHGMDRNNRFGLFGMRLAVDRGKRGGL